MSRNAMSLTFTWWRLIGDEDVGVSRRDADGKGGKGGGEQKEDAST